MEQLLRYLKMAMPYLALAETVARNLDANKTGADDELADQLAESAGFINSVIRLNAESETTVARGYEGIMAFGQNVMNSIELLRASDMSSSAKAAEAKRIVLMLSDPTLVYQPKKGKDADALAHFKRIASDAAAEVNDG